jgi:hypothetical protein
MTDRIVLHLNLYRTFKLHVGRIDFASIMSKIMVQEIVDVNCILILLFCHVKWIVFH